MTALETPPEGLEPIGHPVHPFLWRETVLLRRLQDRLGVLVHPHDEVDLVAAKAAIASDAIGADLLERVSEVGIAVGIVDRGRDIEL